ncbi:MAG: hypothetical protein EHM41_06590 [Chloroflexi bacterium]|nr:MAG: hypothetical protein EHM41_06590 [Chloroflexota bacterium]
MTTAEPETSGSPITDQFPKKDRTLTYIIIGAVALILIAAIVTAVILLLRADPEVTAQIRDVFIIFMALETLLLGLVLVVLIIQIALLTNLLQNELKPILESTNETVNTLRGTTAFLSENMVQPVIKMNEYLAALSQLLSVINLGRRKNKKPQP